MRRRVLVTFAALALSVLAGVRIGSQSPYAIAQGVTPVPGRHSEVRALFAFYIKDTPDQQGWRLAEFKDEGPKSQYYKADVLPGCGEWVVAPGTEPGLILTPGGSNCQGFRIDFGVFYWFDTPPITVVTASPSATVTLSPPPFEGATATPSLAVTLPVTVTPSPQGEGPTVTPTVTPTATPGITETLCSPALNIYGVDDRVKWGNVPSVHYYVGNGCGALVVLLEKPMVITAYNRMLDGLLEESLRALVQRCMAHPDECEALLTPEAAP